MSIDAAFGKEEADGRQDHRHRYGEVEGERRAQQKPHDANRAPLGSCRFGSFPRRGVVLSSGPKEDRASEHNEQGKSRRFGTDCIRKADISESPEAKSGIGKRRDHRPALPARRCRGCEPRYGEEDEERPDIRRFGGNQRRRQHRTEKSETGERLSVQQRQADGGEGDEAKQDKGGAGADIVVDAISRINHTEQRQCTGRGEHTRYHGIGVGGGDAWHRLAADRFTGKPEKEAENGGERQPDRRAEQA